jgi:hypothetical protein
MLHGFSPFRCTQSNLESDLLRKVLWLEEIGHVLWLGVQVHGVMAVVSVVSVRIVGRTDVVHLVGGSTLHAARLGLAAFKSDPENVVGVSWEAGAADVLLVTGRVDNDGVLWGACSPSASVSFLSRALLVCGRIAYNVYVTYPGG